MNFKILKHDDGSYGRILNIRLIVRTDLPQLLDKDTQLETMVEYFSEYKTMKQESPLKGWNLVTVTLTELL